MCNDNTMYGIKTQFGYLCTRRPAGLGATPNGEVGIECFDGATVVQLDYRKFNYKPWNVVYYAHELSVEDVERYELTPKFDFTGGLLTEFFQIRDEIKSGSLEIDFDTVVNFNRDNKWFADYGLMLLNTIRYSPLDKTDWCALYIMLCVR